MKKKKLVIGLIIAIVIVGLIGGFLVYAKNTGLLFVAPTPEPTEEVLATPEPKKITPSKMGVAVNAPVTLPKKVSVGPFYYWNDGVQYFDKTGKLYLKNKDVDKKLVNKIDSIYKEARSNGDYCWVSAPPSSDGVKFQNGIMSLAMRKGNGRGAIEVLKTYNVDVRTGNEIDLRSVFADNVDAEAELNRYLYLYALSYFEDEAYKFKGIDMSTPFVLNLENGLIYLYPDENTPLFSGQELRISFKSFGNNGEVIAIYDRFPALKDSEMDTASLKALVDTQMKKNYEGYKEGHGLGYYGDEPLKSYEEYKADNGDDYKHMNKWDIEYVTPKTKSQIDKYNNGLYQ